MQWRGLQVYDEEKRKEAGMWERCQVSVSVIWCLMWWVSWELPQAISSHLASNFNAKNHQQMAFTCKPLSTWVHNALPYNHNNTPADQVSAKRSDWSIPRHRPLSPSSLPENDVTIRRRAGARQLCSGPGCYEVAGRSSSVTLSTTRPSPVSRVSAQLVSQDRKLQPAPVWVSLWLLLSRAILS